MKWSEAYEHSGWTISVPVKLIHAIGAKGAILVAQLFYWKGKEQSQDGWIYKTKAQLEQETGLSRHEQDTCTEELKKKKVLETRYDRLDHRLYYKIRTESLDAIMDADSPGESRKADFGKAEPEEESSPPSESRKPDLGKPGVAKAESGASPKPETGRPESRNPGFVNRSENTSETTSKKTTTTPRAHVSAKGMRLVAEEVREVVVVSSCVVEEEEPEEPSKEEYWPDEDDSPVADQPPWPDDEAEEELPTVTEEQKTASAAVDAIATEFGLGVVGRGEIQHYLGLKGFAYVQAKATLAKSAPRSNIGGYFLAALRKDYQAPKSTAPAPKPKGPTEPAGWREGLRAVAQARYPGADPEAWSYWKNVPRSLQVEVLAELARPTAANSSAVVTGAVKADFAAMRAAVQNVGKEETAA